MTSSASLSCQRLAPEKRQRLIEPIPTLLLSPRAILPIRHVQDDFEFADIEEAIRELKAGRNDALRPFGSRPL